MNVFRVSFKIRPVEDSIQLRGLAGGYATAWVASDTESGAHEVAGGYFSKHGWIVESLEVPETLPHEHLSLFERENNELYHQMMRHGIVAEIYSYPDGTESHDKTSPRYLKPVDC